MILGQESLIQIIDSFSLESFPKSILLQGLKGSGKHMICDYISTKFNLPIENISKSINIDKLEEIYKRVEPYLYIIDMNIITAKNKVDKEQSILLKFIEEPLQNSFIIILCENTNQLLPTIHNRCFKLFMNIYSKEILGKFIDLDCDNKLILDIAKTPGQIREIKGEKLSDALEFTNKIIDNLASVPYYNALKISDSIAFEDEKNKYSLDVLTSLIVYNLRQRLRKEYTDKYYFMYVSFNTLIQELNLPYINKKYLFENKLFEIKQGLSK